MKKVLFFLLAPIFLPLHLFLVWAYGEKEKAGAGWYQNLWDQGLVSKIIFILLAPIIFPLVGFMYIAYPFWEDLGK